MTKKKLSYFNNINSIYGKKKKKKCRLKYNKMKIRLLN